MMLISSITWSSLRQNFIWGLGARFSPSDFVQTVPSLEFIPHHIDNNVYSGFVQDEIAIVPNKFSLTLGTKLEHNNYTGFEVQPSIRGLWTITPRHSVLGSGDTRSAHAVADRRGFQLTWFLAASPPILR